MVQRIEFPQKRPDNIEGAVVTIDMFFAKTGQLHIGIKNDAKIPHGSIISAIEVLKFNLLKSMVGEVLNDKPIAEQDKENNNHEPS